MIICLWMKDYAQIYFYTQSFLERSPKLGGELSSSVRDDGQGNPMQPHNLLDVQLGILLRSVSCLNC